MPYILWKLCPSLQKRLLTIICGVWKNKSIPYTSWKQAIIILLHKSGPSSSPANFRPIALTNCDGKLFFSILASRIAYYMCQNGHLKPFHYGIGVFQGCVLSPVLFNICFQPLLDLVSTASKTQEWSYTFKSDSAINRDVSAFSDNIEPCSCHQTLCQEQINIFDRYLSWSGSMHAHPNKCSAAAFRQSNSVGSSGITGYDRFDPHLSSTFRDLSVDPGGVTRKCPA